MKLLITGAGGFIGSCLCNYFSALGHSVVATARDTAGIPDGSGNKMIRRKLDVLREADFAALEVEGVDAIIHTATANDIVSKNPADGVMLSAIGTRNVLNYCVNSHIPKIIYFSTFQVYGTELTGEIDELTPVHCTNDYGLNHLFGEQYVEMYARKFNLSGMVVRPSNVYGGFTTPFIDRWTLVPGCFCKELFSSGVITLHSSGRQTRNFVSLSSVCRGLECLLKLDKKGFEIYNIASTCNAAILEVAEQVLAIYQDRYKKNGVVKVLGEKPDRPNLFRVKMEKMREAGFEERHDYTLASAITEIFINLEKTISNGSYSTI